MSANTNSEDTSVTFNGWATTGAKDLFPFSYHPRPLGPKDVEIEITHSGICGTDCHVLNGFSPFYNFPCILGHEIVGRVSAVGSETIHKIGDIVGVGCQVQTCNECDRCKTGMDHYCKKATLTYGSKYHDEIGGNTHGGYADRIRVTGDLVFKIPREISSLEASPLFCAGITTYSPLKRFGAGPGKRVGIVGIGGLGHLGIQWARALECDEVVAISTSDTKKAEAKKLGATKFINSNHAEEMKASAGELDIILCTTSFFGDGSDVSSLLSLLAPTGTFVALAKPEGDSVKIPAYSLLFSGINIAGSKIGSKAEIKEMLEFAVKTNVRPWIEKFDFNDVASAMRHADVGRPRYRVVMEH